MWRWRIPVRSTIHASLVSIVSASSSLLTTLAGRYAPVAITRARSIYDARACRRRFASSSSRFSSAVIR